MDRVLWVVVTGGFGVICLTTALLWRADRAGGDRMVAEWARAHGVRMTEDNRPLVRYYLVLGRVLRTIGGVAGIVIGGLVDAATGVDVDHGFLWWVWIMGGYLAGAMWAELFLTRPAPSRRAASLVPRRLPDYLPARLRWALRLAGVASLAVGVAGWAVDQPAGDASRFTTVSADAAIVLGVAGAVIAGLVELLQITIVRRPQPVVAADLLEADDAIRASSVHSLAGAGLGMVVLIVATVMTRLINVNGRLPLGLGGAPFVLFVAGLLGWRYYSHRAWRVRRPDPMQSVAP